MTINLSSQTIATAKKTIDQICRGASTLGALAQMREKSIVVIRSEFGEYLIKMTGFSLRSPRKTTLYIHRSNQKMSGWLVLSLTTRSRKQSQMKFWMNWMYNVNPRMCSLCLRILGKNEIYLHNISTGKSYNQYRCLYTLQFFTQKVVIN